MRLYLVRHGETAPNRDGVGLGRDDVPLTATGREQAARLRARLADVELDAAYASPLARAMDTAAGALEGSGLAVTPIDELIELDVGLTEGMTFPTMREQHAGFLREWAGPEGYLARFPGGERLIDVDQRVASFLVSLRDAEIRAALIVSHNFVLRLLICRVLGLEPLAFRNVIVDLASLTTLDLRDGRAIVASINDTCHLNGLREE